MTEFSSSPTSYRPEEVLAMLAMASTGEPGRDSFSPAVQLSQLTAHEIVSAVHAVADASDRIHQQHMGEPVEAEEVDRRLVGYGDDISNTFDDLPTFIGEEKTRDVFTMLANSRSPRDRAYIGLSIGVLTRIDHDYGFEMWKRLLGDGHPDVSGAAWDTTSHLYGSVNLDKPEETKAMLARYGLTWLRLTDLIDEYVLHLKLKRDTGGSADNPPS